MMYLAQELRRVCWWPLHLYPCTALLCGGAWPARWDARFVAADWTVSAQSPSPVGWTPEAVSRASSGSPVGSSGPSRWLWAGVCHRCRSPESVWSRRLDSGLMSAEPGGSLSVMGCVRRVREGGNCDRIEITLSYNCPLLTYWDWSRCHTLTQPLTSTGNTRSTAGNYFRVTIYKVKLSRVLKVEFIHLFPIFKHIKTHLRLLFNSIETKEYTKNITLKILF